MMTVVWPRWYSITQNINSRISHHEHLGNILAVQACLALRHVFQHLAATHPEKLVSADLQNILPTQPVLWFVGYVIYSSLYSLFVLYIKVKSFLIHMARNANDELVVLAQVKMSFLKLLRSCHFFLLSVKNGQLFLALSEICHLYPLISKSYQSTMNVPWTDTTNVSAANNPVRIQCTIN